MTDRELMTMALEALNCLQSSAWEIGERMGADTDKAITALRERLAQPEQEPVANGWSVFNTAVEVWSGLSFADAVAELSPSRVERGWSAVCVINKDNPPLYTTPLDRMAENARELGLDYEPVQEPVAWRDHVEQRLLTWRQSFVNRSGDQLALDDFMDKESLDDLIDYVCDEYTTPPRRVWVGLDRKEMLAIIDEQQAYKSTGLPMFYRDQCLDMARAIEAKLREKNQ